jgi:hypothetical protein
MSEEAGIVIGRHTRGGASVVYPTPVAPGFRAMLTGSGDDGTRIKIAFTGAATQNVAFAFDTPIYIHGGTAHWSGTWDHMLDTLAFSVEFGATPVTVNGGGTGNCNVVSNVMVPAAGDGGYDVVLANAVPLPVSDPDSPDGYWDVDYRTGDVTVSTTPGTARFHLLDVPQSSEFVRDIGMNGNGEFHPEPVGREWVHQNATFKLEVVKGSAGAGDVTGWVMTSRP